MKQFQDWVEKKETKNQKALVRMFAEEIGVSSSYFGQLKSGYRNIGDRTAGRIEKALSLRPDELSEPPSILTPAAIKIAKKWMALSKDEQKTVSAHIDFTRSNK